MSIDALAAIGGTQPVLSVLPDGMIGVQPPAEVSFESVLGGLETLNTQLLSSQAATAKIAAGGPDSLHHTVMGMEQTRLSFELMLAVRNKVLDAYQELMRMQV